MTTEPDARELRDSNTDFHSKTAKGEPTKPRGAGDHRHSAAQRGRRSRSSVLLTVFPQDTYPFPRGVVAWRWGQEIDSPDT